MIITNKKIDAGMKGDAAQQQPPVKLVHTGISRKNGYKKIIPRSSKYSKYKIIKSGKMVEVYASEFPFIIRPEPRTIREYCDSLPLVADILTDKIQEKSSRSEEYRKQSANRARTRVRRLVLNNFKKYDKFITLTFSRENKFDITDIKQCHTRFQTFIKSLQAFFPSFSKYVATFEYQKDGTVHYHVVCDLPYIDYNDFYKFWSYGMFDITAITQSSSVGFYISKYITKEFLATNPGQRRFFCSNNLELPTAIYGDIAEQLAIKLLKNHQDRLVHQYSYNSEINGIICYQLYNMNREEVVKPYGREVQRNTS